jgi:carboxymethylenebutenolidase
MKTLCTLLLALVIHAAAVCVYAQTVTGPDNLIIPSGPLRLRALLWRPKGSGPFPAVLFNHGRGLTSQTEGRLQDITELGRVFASHGYVFLALFRRGEDLSADQGLFIGDLLEQERSAKGDEAAKKLQVRLLESDHLEDALAGLTFLRTLPNVDRRRVVVAGHSFGGSLTLLVAERDRSVAAAVSFAGAAGSWEDLPGLRERLTTAIRRLTAPVFFVYAANDYSVAPGKVLDGEMTRRSKAHRLKIYSAFGRTAREGHQFVYQGIPIWEQDVFGFLDEHLKP